MFQRISIAILIAAACVDFARADSPSVTAVLSNSEATVGETVELQIKVTGPGDARPPEEISIDGLEIHSTGTSRQFEIHNFSTSSSVTYNYTILPLRAGRFTIPPQTVLAGGKILRTPELALNVADVPGQQTTTRPGRSAQGTQSQSTNARDMVFAELIVPKKTAYVGEIVPVQIRMGFDARVHPRLTEPPDITGQGFTSQKLQQSSQNLETINGRPFEVVTFKTAIAAARAGKFEIGPLQAKAQVVVPRRRNAPRSRSPFDLFDLDDPFSDPFFSNPFAQFGERRDVQITSEPVSLEVKPLPPNAPPSFSGAIGSFTMATDAKPKSVQVGDPITVTTTISGRGNFDRVNAPLLEDDRGWHKYPPSSKFKQDDEVGISGTKTFEMVVSPNENKQSLPVLAFSYFDPVKEQYVTLHSEQTTITVQGGAVAPAVAARPPSSAAATASRGRAAVSNSNKPQDILYQLTEPSRTVASFEPLYTRRGFWVAQSLPLAALFVFAGWKIRRARLDDREARRIGALQHEATELMNKLRRDDASPREYYAEASRVVRLKAALASRNRAVDPNAVDAETASETFKLDTDSRDQLRRLFEKNDEWQYSGTHNSPLGISPENRRDVLELIENLK
ncbi:MAG TPA: BatD family protein [Candidatus Udaeobacter sp.]|nr:BatD family protein [Candidatus Udaeobacter sp.]